MFLVGFGHVVFVVGCSGCFVGFRGFQDRFGCLIGDFFFVLWGASFLLYLRWSMCLLGVFNFFGFHMGFGCCGYVDPCGFSWVFFFL